MLGLKKINDDPEFLREHKQKYKLFLERQSKIDPIEQSDQILEVKAFLKKHRIPCFKYNYSLDHETQNFSSFQCYLQLSKDGEQLLITCRKPTEFMQSDLVK